MKAFLDSAVSGISTSLKTPQSPQSTSLSDLTPSRSWNEITHKMSEFLGAPSKSSLPISQQLGNITDLFKLQMDVSRYQLKIELVSKVSESAVASMRKLQQNQ